MKKTKNRRPVDTPEPARKKTGDRDEISRKIGEEDIPASKEFLQMTRKALSRRRFDLTGLTQKARANFEKLANHALEQWWYQQEKSENNLR